MDAVALPDHYRLAIRRLVRFAVVFMILGMLLGILSTEYQRRLRYTHGANDPPRWIEPKVEGGPPTKLEVPPGMMWEIGYDLRILHGHFILIGGVIPLCFAACFFFLPPLGARPMSNALMTAGLGLYLAGTTAALMLIFYKGLFSMVHALDPKNGGHIDLAEIHASMFGGSRGFRAAAHAISHTVLAAGFGVLGFGLWRSAGEIKLRSAAPAS